MPFLHYNFFVIIKKKKKITYYQIKLWVISHQPAFLPILSPYWEDSFLVGPGKTHSSPTLFSPGYQKHNK